MKEIYRVTTKNNREAAWRRVSGADIEAVTWRINRPYKEQKKNPKPRNSLESREGLPCSLQQKEAREAWGREVRFKGAPEPVHTEQRGPGLGTQNFILGIIGE